MMTVKSPAPATRRSPGPVQIIGVEARGSAPKTGDFAQYLFTGRRRLDPRTNKTYEERLSAPSFAVAESPEDQRVNARRNS